MALTEEQEKQLLDSHASLSKQIADLLPAVESLKPLTEKVSALEKENGELKKGMSISSQEQAILTLKTKYPDVPESVIRSTPEAQRDAVLKDVQDKFSTVKAAAKTDPDQFWANAGSIGPTDEAERAAAQQAKAKEYADSQSRGDVGGMLKARSAEVVKFLRGSFVKQ